MTDAGGLDAVLRYHERSTHHPHRFAPGPGRLDWANQPEPFRSYAGASRVEFPLASDDLPASWGDLHRLGVVLPRPPGRASLGAFFELALGLTAWKEHGGARWALRANPSSGNLHPTEGYLLVAEADGVPAGLHHYLSRDHVLEQRWAPTTETALARLLPPGAFLVGLASIHWREAWKYGERAFRYCQHDVGHALGAVRYAAAVLGWSARLLDTPGDDDVSALLGLDREGDFADLAPADREHPDGLVLVAPGAGIDAAIERMQLGLAQLREALRGGTWSGTPNPLSPEHVEWPAIAEVAAAAVKPRTPAIPAPALVIPMDFDGTGPEGSALGPGDGLPAVRLIRQRRSAVAMDGATGLSAATFFGLLDRLVPRPGIPPWDALPWAPRAHPVLFVHRVDGLASGLYLLERSPGAHEPLREALRPSFDWKHPEGCPEGLRLFRLEEGDTRSFARAASCQQEIASDSAFAVAMLAEVGPALDAGAWWYRRLYWETGLLGQVLYLEAEAAGVRATGIGCFFDDVVHDTLGLADGRFRDLYHFTVGGAVEDRRLTTRPGYDDSVKRRRP
ncbi:MAG TPA: SagB/ThcOx family dehydrogenase [Vicinamibacteria bacterium]|nr:SagB/ThcOx family dehydrogenase [Vicinamibacteria bacterium]